MYFPFLSRFPSCLPCPAFPHPTTNRISALLRLRSISANCPSSLSMRRDLCSLKEKFASREIDSCDANEITRVPRLWAQSISADSFSRIVLVSPLSREINYLPRFYKQCKNARINHYKSRNRVNHTRGKSCRFATTICIFFSALMRTIAVSLSPHRLRRRQRNLCIRRVESWSALCNLIRDNYSILK